jgi:uncharacterized protein
MSSIELPLITGQSTENDDNRPLCLAAMPTTMPITNMDMDLTVDCNMRCVYCFKEKRQEEMSKKVAFDSIIWFIYASGQAQEIYVNFLGGEPLLRFELIKQLVPFGTRRAWQHNKKIHFGITTNCTLVTDEVIDFWKKWNIGFHTSIDGIPDVQNRNRPLVSGEPSAPLVEQAVPKILACRPNTMARSTVVPENVAHCYDNYKYFRSLGYTRIGLVPGDGKDWDEKSINLFEEQFRQIADALIAEFRKGVFVHVKGIHDYLIAEDVKERRRFACGAGRGTVLVDVHGHLYPCHRWNKLTENRWRIGSIYETFDDDARSVLRNGCPSDRVPDACGSCTAKRLCNGGCPAENLEESDSPFTMSENKCRLTVALARTAGYVKNTLEKEKCSEFLKHYGNKAV